MWAVAKPASSIARSIASGRRSLVTACVERRAARVADERRGEHVVVALELREHEVPGAPGVGEAVQEHERRPGAAAVGRGEGRGHGRQARWLDSPGLLRDRSTQSHGVCSTGRGSARGGRLCRVDARPRPRRRPVPAGQRAAIATARGRSRECRDGRLVAAPASWPCSRSTAARSRSRSPTSAPSPAAGSVQTHVLVRVDGSRRPAVARSVNDSCTNGEFHRNVSLSGVPWTRARLHLPRQPQAHAPRRPRPPPDHEGQAHLGQDPQRLRVRRRHQLQDALRRPHDRPPCTASATAATSSTSAAWRRSRAIAP